MAPIPGRENEDVVVAGPDWVIVVDGATPWPGRDSGCVHGVAWFAQRLAVELAARLTGEPAALSAILAAAIADVAESHAATCDLSNPDSPSATALVLRRNADAVDYLVLADSVLVFDVDGRLTVVTDDRIDQLDDYTPDGIARARNQPGGFWVAAARPDAAEEAITGSVPLAGLRRAALLTDGAARLVQRFAAMDWSVLLDLLGEHGPATLLEATRAAEDADDGSRPGKRYDDATAVLVTW